MALELDIQAAIEKNLSAEVGATLKKRLELAEADARRVGEQRQLIETLKAEVTSLTDKVKSQEAVEQRIQVAQKAEAAALAATTLKAIVELKEKHADEKVRLVTDVVKSVFANNQYKYLVTDNGYMPVSTGMGGMSQSSHNRTITGQGEGAPPPSPGDVSR